MQGHHAVGRFDHIGSAIPGRQTVSPREPGPALVDTDYWLRTGHSPPSVPPAQGFDLGDRGILLAQRHTPDGPRSDEDNSMRHEAVIEVMNDPVAQELLFSSIPVRMAYTALEGSPRVVPLGFHWNGARFVVCTAPNAPKVLALAANPKVALTVDTNTQPPRLLLVRGTASIEVVDGVPPEYLEGAKKLMPAQQMQGFEAHVHTTFEQMARIEIVPEWAKVLDFETRFPGGGD